MSETDLTKPNGAQASFLNSKEVVQKEGKERINDFLRNHACYDLLKHSGKVGLCVGALARPYVNREGLANAYVGTKQMWIRLSLISLLYWYV